jgi:hypothetical protein
MKKKSPPIRVRVRYLRLDPDGRGWPAGMIAGRHRLTLQTMLIMAGIGMPLVLG